MYAVGKICMITQTAIYDTIFSSSYCFSQDGDYYTEAQCEAVVLCGNNHWIITPNLTRSIRILFLPFL